MSDEPRTQQNVQDESLDGATVETPGTSATEGTATSAMPEPDAPMATEVADGTQAPATPAAAPVDDVAGAAEDGDPTADLGPAASERPKGQDLAGRPNPPAELAAQPVPPAVLASQDIQHDTLGGNVEDEDLEAQLAYQTLKRNREARKRKRRIIIVVAIIAVLAGVVWFVVNQANSAMDATTVDTGPITSMAYRGDFTTVITANGATEPLSSTIVSPEVDGIIENVRIEEGSFVNEGDVLFTIKNDDLQKAINDASRQLESAKRNESSTNTAVNDAYAAYQRSWNEHNAAGDWSTFDEAGLRQAIRSAEDAHADAQAAVDTAQTTLDEAQARADKRTVKAPVSGSVVAMNAVNGAAVGAASGSTSSNAANNGPLVQISDLSQMKVTVQVNELDISTITAGQPAKATFSAISDLELDATVQRIASTSTGSGDSGSSGVVTYAVDLLIPKPDPRLKPGMTATVKITTQNVPDTIIVPVASLSEDANGATVTVVQGDDMKIVPVEIVAKNGSEAAVKGELNDGDAVLLAAGAGDAGTAGSDATPTAG